MGNVRHAGPGASLGGVAVDSDSRVAHFRSAVAQDL